MFKNKLIPGISLICISLIVIMYGSSVTFGSSVSSLIKDLGSWDKKVAKEASEKLSKRGKSVVPELINAMDNKDRRKYATRTLREIGQDASDAIPALIKAASDSDEDTRAYAVEALGKMVSQAEQVLPCLEKALNDKSSDVKAKAIKSLNFLKTYPDEVKRQKELAEQKELKKQDDARKQKELAEQEEQKKQAEIKKQQEEIRKQKELAEQGNAAAQYSLGLMYYDGKGVLRDYNEAVKWFTKAAEQGHADSQFFLGQMYYDGKGVLESEDEAVKWLTKAAEQGHKDAQASLLEMKNAKETLKIKGFYIGMSLDKAVKLLNEKYKDIALNSHVLFGVDVGDNETLPAEKPVRIEGGTYYFDHDISYKNSVSLENFELVDPFSTVMNPVKFFIKADESGKVILIFFSPWVVNKLFNVKDMDGESFAQTFINNYSIPQLKPEIIESIEGGDGYLLGQVWTYTSDKGFKVTIAEDKTLLIKKVASAKERKFN